MGILFQTFRPSRGLAAKGSYLLKKWNSLSVRTRQDITNKVLHSGLHGDQPSSQIKDELAKAVQRKG